MGGALFQRPTYRQSKLKPAIILCLLAAIIFSLCIYPPSQAEGATKAWFENIKIERGDKGLIFSATLVGAFNNDVKEAISGGTVTRFKFNINIKRRRGFWFDKNIRKYEILHTVAFDVLKKEYTVLKTYPDGNEENLTTAQWNTMEKWMSHLRFPDTSFPEIQEEDVEHFFNIKAELKCIKIPFPLNYLLVFLPLWNFDTPWFEIPFPKIPYPADIDKITYPNLKGNEIDENGNIPVPVFIRR